MSLSDTARIAEITSDISIVLVVIGLILLVIAKRKGRI